jgi:3-isopropylmalate/(R)-2-methylmalate dehydratase small subunit
MSMAPFTTHAGIAAPLVRINIDTDAIIPSREMKRVSREGLGEGMFANWRYSDVASRTENPDFVLNQGAFRRATILLAGVNFGCGSSREHAVWALKDFGIRAILAPSFGSIFYGNCILNGILPIRLDEASISRLAALHAAQPEAELGIDLPAQQIHAADGSQWAFEIPSADKQMLIEGLDQIALTLKHGEAIEAFVARDRAARPWIYAEPGAQPGGG